MQRVDQFVFKRRSSMGIFTALQVCGRASRRVDFTRGRDRSRLGAVAARLLTAPDIDPSELAQVEVLRGPQGTLYGASSIGGLLKYVTVDPSTDALSGRIQAGTSSVRNGAELGYSFRGSVNIPLSDTLALRASGFTRRDPGYIDDPMLNAEGVNKVTTQGGRLSALWRPSHEFSWKASALYQDSKASGSPYVDVQPGLGNLQQSDVRGTGDVDFIRRIAGLSLEKTF
jgi:outer membrane receptor protein involved in Fe transport